MVMTSREIYEILRTRERWPILTICLAALLISIFVLQQYQVISLEEYGLISAQVWNRPHTLITSIFLHLHLAHLGMNLLALVYFGVWLECASEVKRKNILLTFFLSGLAGSFAIAVIFPTGRGIGASDALFGWLGLLIVAPTHSFFLFLGIALGVLGFIVFPLGVYTSHLAGLIAGLLLAIYWRSRKSAGFTQ